MSFRKPEVTMTFTPKIHLTDILLFLIIVLNCGCNDTNNQGGKISKDVLVDPSDPFRATMVRGETHLIDPTEPTVITGSKGTRFVIPEGCFISASGKKVKDLVEVTIAEALSTEEQLLSGLNTGNSNAVMGSEGAVYISAKANGEALQINKEKPVLIQVLATLPKADVMAMKGVRKADGSMAWMSPVPAQVFLENIDPSLMHFLPDSFELAVQAGMPFRNHSVASPALADSLYYSFAASDQTETPSVIDGEKLNEPYYHPDKKIVDGKYTASSYYYERSNKDSLSDSSGTRYGSGIDPALIKMIRSPKYHQSFIFTSAFDERLRMIFKSCNNKILEVYLQHLTEPLYISDSIAATLTNDPVVKDAFMRFAALKLTNVKEAGRYASLLRKGYQDEWQKLKKELEEVKRKVSQAMAEERAEAGKLQEKYRELLLQRESFRMEKYNCEWTDTGWVNLFHRPPNVFEYPISVHVEDGATYDRLYVYTLLADLKSIGRLNSEDQQLYYFGDIRKKLMPIPEHERCFLIAVGYKGKKLYQGFSPIDQHHATDLKLVMNSSTEKDLRYLLHQFGNFSHENSILVDLNYMRKFSELKKSQDQRRSETLFTESLRRYVFPCASGGVLTEGRQLFRSNCAACHSEGTITLVGPGLSGATERYSRTWLYQWTREAMNMIASGDETAVAIYNRYKKVGHPGYRFTDSQINAIYSYIDSIRR